MTVLAVAAATQSTVPWTKLVVIGLALLAGYFIVCSIWPWTSCPWCDGGKKRSPSGRNWRDCGRCKGTGKRVRTGRRVWSYGTNIRDAARR